jgi:hypothetical protein
MGTAGMTSGSGGLGASGSGGSGGMGSGSGGAGASGSGGSDGGMTTIMAHGDLGKGDGSDVVLIGDSWMSNTLQIEGTGGGVGPSLVAVAMQKYANYGVQGTMLLMADTFGPAIPTQYEQAKQLRQGIKTIVMTGGGNDVIQNPSLSQACMVGGDQCKQLLIQIGQTLDTLWTEMANDGVQDVIYIRYTDNTGTLDPSLQGDKGVPTPSICLTGKIWCHSIETTDIVAATDLAADGIHPLAPANDRIAQRVWDTMVQNGCRR